MISAARLAANRANAQKSTGPRTAGKMRAAQNARRHGLTLPVASDPDCREAIAAFAQAIVRSTGTPDLYALAVQIAAAEIDLRRVRHARLPLLEVATPEAICRLAAIDRYEGRALSRRNCAMRAFARARCSLQSHQPAQICQNEPNPTGPFCQNEPNPSPAFCQNEAKPAGRIRSERAQADRPNPTLPRGEDRSLSRPHDEEHRTSHRPRAEERRSAEELRFCASQARCDASRTIEAARKRAASFFETGARKAAFVMLSYAPSSE
jgi:hypothetical protein